jgi:hypothetical protein
MALDGRPAGVGLVFGPAAAARAGQPLGQQQVDKSAVTVGKPDRDQ